MRTGCHLLKRVDGSRRLLRLSGTALIPVTVGRPSGCETHYFPGEGIPVQMMMPGRLTAEKLQHSSILQVTSSVLGKFKLHQGTDSRYDDRDRPNSEGFYELLVDVQR